MNEMHWTPSQQCSSVTGYEDMGFHIISHDTVDPVREERDRFMGAMALVQLAHSKPTVQTASQHKLLR